MERNEVARKLIVNDIEGIINAIFSCTEKTRSILSMGALLYFAMIISNAIDWCSKANIRTEPFVDKDIVDKLRAKVKLYSSDNLISLNEQKIIMSDIVETEKQYWIDEQAKSGKWCPRFLIPDIGCYIANGHFVGSTLEYAYEYAPLNPEKQPILAAISGSEKEDSLSYRFSVGLGKTLQGLYNALTDKSCSIDIDNIVSVVIDNKDIRMSNRSYFTKDNAIFALNLCCRINFLLEVFLPLCEQYPFLAFRMIYITFYHTKADFQNLGLDFVHYNMPYRDKSFRDSMAHYSLYGKIEDTDIIDSVIGYGLIEKFFDGENFETVNNAVINEFRKTRDSLEKYVKI